MKPSSRQELLDAVASIPESALEGTETITVKITPTTIEVSYDPPIAASVLGHAQKGYGFSRATAADFQHVWMEALSAMTDYRRTHGKYPSEIRFNTKTFRDVQFHAKLGFLTLDDNSWSLEGVRFVEVASQADPFVVVK